MESCEFECWLGGDPLQRRQVKQPWSKASCQTIFSVYTPSGISSCSRYTPCVSPGSTRTLCVQAGTPFLPNLISTTVVLRNLMLQSWANTNQDGPLHVYLSLSLSTLLPRSYYALLWSTTVLIRHPAMVCGDLQWPDTLYCALLRSIAACYVLCLSTMAYCGRRRSDQGSLISSMALYSNRQTQLIPRAYL